MNSEIEFDNIIEAINKAEKIGIFTHISPDGDAIGSSLGMYLALTGMKKDVDIITDELATGRSVKVSGFASFEPYSKKERIGRNPKNGKTYPISSRTVLSFRASPNLKKRIESTVV